MTGINFLVCYYCKHIRIQAVRNSSRELCNQTGKAICHAVPERGVPAHKRSMYVKEYMSSGCGNFDASGVPTKQYVKDWLINLNPNAISIPTDEQATEDSWDFSDKVTKHIEVNNNRA